MIVTSWIEGSRRARWKVRFTTSSSSSRPMNGVRTCRSTSAPKRLRSPMGRQRRSGSALPLTRTGSSSWYSARCLVARYVASDTIAPPIGATSCRRAAVLTTSPVTIPSAAAAEPATTSVSPVEMPIRTARSRPGFASFSSSIARSIAKAHRRPRSASSSWAAGAPKTATTASPMNFSTVPPKRSIAFRSRLK